MHINTVMCLTVCSPLQTFWQFPILLLPYGLLILFFCHTALILELTFYLFICIFVVCGMWNLILWLGIQPGPPTLGTLSLSSWTTRKVPILGLWFSLSNDPFAMLSRSVKSDSATPWTVAHQAPLSIGNLQAWILGMGCRALLQGIFPIQGSNPGLCIAGGFFTFWATREALHILFDIQSSVSKTYVTLPWVLMHGTVLRDFWDALPRL